MMLGGATNMWYEVATGNLHSVGFATMFTLVAIALLLWVSTARPRFCRALLQIERAALHSYGLDPHSCWVLRGFLTGS